MESNGTALMGLTDGWLNNSAQTISNGVGSLTNCMGSYINGYNWYPSYVYPLTTYISSPARPIKLKLSEVEKLRKAAKADKSLKEILTKFTGLIELTVDFD